MQPQASVDPEFTVRPLITYGAFSACRACVGLRLGDAGATGEVRLRDADTAMYAAKADGRGNVKVYHPAMHSAVQERLTIASGLAQAIAGDQVVPGVPADSEPDGRFDDGGRAVPGAP